MLRKSNFLILLVLLPAFFSCNEESKTNLMPPITGRPGEVTLIMNEALYEGSLGDSLYAVICQEEQGLPQTGMEGAEPMFDLIQLPPEGFGNMFRSNRNIIIVTIDPKLEKAAIQVERDYWAKYQLLIRLAAPDEKQLAKLIYDKDDFIVETLRETEIKREVFFNNKFENTDLLNQMVSRHGISVQFQKGWQKRVDSSSFVWMQQTPPDVQQGVLIKYYPFIDEEQITYDGLIRDTEKWLKKNIPGERQGSYMSLELEHPPVPVTSRTFEKDGIYIRELKGLWELQKEFMGGPFISWSFVDEPRNRIVTIFGYVYAPKVNKRNNIRRVESILHTVKFPDQE